MNMTGGYVTGNYSGLAGGGIYAGFHSHNVKFTMSGGTIASNCAELGEGGGLRIAGGTDGVIQATNKVYITNNITNTNNDWGGGGIFVQDKGNLNITNALITDNTAGGYGGGVAACPTGETLITHTDGAAIYENIDYGKKMSGGGNDKTADKEVAQKTTPLHPMDTRTISACAAVATTRFLWLLVGCWATARRTGLAPVTENTSQSAKPAMPQPITSLALPQT